ncbi:MAG: ribonuclease, partial [Acidimicrobiaceae bacterium]|nr:ribonuclease [Acidimicrobiaceae bacterium]
MAGPPLVEDQSSFERDVVAPLLELDEAGSYALDTEFHRERTYWPHLALVQLAWAETIVVVDPLSVDIRPLKAVLEGPATCLAHAADQDLEVLRHACRATPSRLFDTQLAAGFVGMASPSLVSLVEKLLGTRLPKGDRLTDWSRRPLTESQLSYAASDVAHLHELTAVLEAQLLE